jgi:hypothetical protein
MVGLNSTVFVVLFSISLVATYFAVRMGWIRSIPAFAAGTVVTSMFFFMYALARGNPFSQALLVGPILGVVFTGLGVTMALYFRNAAPVSVTEQQTVKSSGMSGVETPQV